MNNFRVRGGTRLRGSIETGYAKNAALPILAATLLTNEPSIIHHVPRIEEINRFEEIFKSIGIGFEWITDDTVQITPPEEYQLDDINYDAATRTRSILYLIGALAWKYNEFKIPHAGGCSLGKRTKVVHEIAFEAMKMQLTNDEMYTHVFHDSLYGTRIPLYEKSDTGTCNILLGAVLAEGVTTLTYASSNYMTVDLCHALIQMGAKIEGVGTSTLTITGVKQLGGIEYYVMNDPIESMFWFSVAATTQSELEIKACPRDFVELELHTLSQMGLQYSTSKVYTNKISNHQLIDVRISPSELVAPPEKILGQPYPGINLDSQLLFAPIAARAVGETQIHDAYYENRIQYLDYMSKFGVHILKADYHRAFIIGPTNWTPADVVCPEALRPSVNLLTCALAAPGTSIIRKTYQINRGYAYMVERLRTLGADIEHFSE